MIRSTPEEYNLYVNWVLYAILGKTGVSDALITQHRLPIYRMARKLVSGLGVPQQPIYRGLLLEPELVGPDMNLSADKDYKSVSYSTSKDVACWFAHRQARTAAVVVAQRPGVKGWIAEAWPKKEDVLFHWSWATRFPHPDGGEQQIPLWLLSTIHPEMDPRQVEWNMRTQQEVILKPSNRSLSLKPAETVDCPSIGELELRLAPRFLMNPAGDERFREIERAAREGGGAVDRERYYWALVRQGKSHADAYTLAYTPRRLALPDARFLWIREALLSRANSDLRAYTGLSTALLNGLLTYEEALAKQIDDMYAWSGSGEYGVMDELWSLGDQREMFGRIAEHPTLSPLENTPTVYEVRQALNSIMPPQKRKALMLQAWSRADVRQHEMENDEGGHYDHIRIEWTGKRYPGDPAPGDTGDWSISKIGYVISSDPGYPYGTWWNNEFGWVDHAQADVFSLAEASLLILPIGGEWVPL